MSASSPVAVSDTRPGGPREQLIRGASKNRLFEAIAVVVGYTLLAGLLYQTPLAGHGNSLAAGLGRRDNDQFVWMLACQSSRHAQTSARTMAAGADVIPP